MIETTIKCDHHGHAYSYDKKIASLAEAIKDGWYEIEAYSGAIKIKQPRTPEAFIATAKHACCAAHAREAVEAFALELIPDIVKEKEGA